MSLFAKSQEHSASISIAVYYLVLGAMFTASFFPDARLWGLNSWLHYPLVVRLALFGLGLVLPAGLWLFRPRSSETTESGTAVEGGRATYLAIVLVLAALWTGLFYFLCATMHFEGDGYLLLSMLAKGSLPLKFTNYGESLVHRLVFDWFGGDDTQRALLTYHVISYVAGLAFFAATATIAGALYSRLRDRLLFLFGLTTGGYALLFFGHVEHYSLFVVSVGLFVLFGVLITEQKINRWFILLPAAVAIFMHVLGMVLIVPAVYILVQRSGLSRYLADRGRWLAWSIAGIIVIASLIAVYRFYTSNYMFRFSLAPLVTDRFTMEGYTLLSVKHLVDVLNLALLLSPGLLLMVVALPTRIENDPNRRQKYTFLMATVAVTLGAAFVFDPKLGMPRDWDLFAFCGVPLVVLTYAVFLDMRGRDRCYPAVAGLAIALSLLSLIPRAYNHSSEKISLERMDYYIKLDPLRNRGGMNLVMTYYLDQGDSASAVAERESWSTRYPEWAINRQGTILLSNGRYREATAYFERALSINPSYSPAYSNLASAYLYLKQFDSAVEYFQIAEGMNPNSPNQLSNLGAAYFYSHKYNLAEQTLLKAINLSPESVEPRLTLAMLYRETNRQEQYIGILEWVAAKPNPPRPVIEELVAYYVRQKEFEKAEALVKSVTSGPIDSLGGAEPVDGNTTP